MTTKTVVSLQFPYALFQAEGISYFYFCILKKQHISAEMREKMKTTRKKLAILLTFVLSITLLSVPPKVQAAAQAPPDTITVYLKVEDLNSTLVSQNITMTKDDITQINQTFTVESGNVELPVLKSDYFTAAHAIGKYITGISDTPKKDLIFSYGSPAYIKGQKDCNFYSYWSFRVNNASPADESTGYSYTPDTCPVKDGDTIVFFRQGCYDQNAGDFGAYTSYSWFDRDRYETTVNTPVSVTYLKDDGFASSVSPAADETLNIYEGDTFIQEVKTGQDGSALLTFDRAGTYTITGGRLQSGVPVLSNTSAVITVAPAEVPSITPPAAPPATPPSAPGISPSAKPDAGSYTTGAVKKPALPKKPKVSLRRNKITISWKKAAGAKGYQITIVRKKPSKYTKRIWTTKTKFTKKLKAGTYSITIRSYTKKGGRTIYSKSSWRFHGVIRGAIR